MKKLITSVMMVCSMLIMSQIVSAASVIPENVLKHKYPKEKVKLIQTTDLNHDNKMETVMLTESGNFFYLTQKVCLCL